MRRIAVLVGVVGVVSLIGVVAGIGAFRGRGPSKLDSTTRVAARARQAALDSMSQAAEGISAQFGTGPTLGVRVDTACVPGEKGWPHNDDEMYRSECWVNRTTAYAVDAEPLGALGALDPRLAAVGWRRGAGSAGAGWSLTGGRGVVENLDAFTRLGYRIEDLDNVGYSGPRDASLAIQVLPAAADVPAAKAALAAQHGQGSYFASTEGSDWQDDWAQQRTNHPYVVVITGFLIFAQQPW